MNEVLEYLFFTREVAGRFTERLQQRGLVWQEDVEPVQNALVIKISEHIDPLLWDELDDLFDELSSEDQQLLEAGMEDESSASTAGIYLQLAGGRQTIAKVEPDVVNRILSVLSVQELNQFLEVIVSSVENPDDSAICQRI